MSRLPAVHDGALVARPGAAPVPVGSPAWLDWLRDARSFTFAGASGTFTARHEERSGSRFWYAYRRKEGKLRKTYLGRSAELSLHRLEQAARSLESMDGEASAGPSAIDWSFPLIATKIAMPQPGISLIARPQAVARCLESIEHPCTIVMAPAGFGKTTLLVMACEQLKARGWAIAWVSLEESERDPVRFWMYGLEALRSAQPGVGSLAQRMLKTLRLPPIEHILTTVINELAAAPARIVLVLDDYHLAATEASDRGLAFLIEHAPPFLRLVVTTRTAPAFPIARLRAQGRIGELHAADLRFSAEEAERFMRETMHLSLPPDEVAKLDEQTEGWVAGLQLAGLSLREHADLPDLTSVIVTARRYIADYLFDEILERQSSEVQDFLLQTAPLERLTGPLCDAITGRTDSAAMLARLMQAQLFVTPLDPGQTWYRYHHLFAEVLCERLKRTSPDVLECCHRRAAAWLQQQGMTGEAIHHLVEAQAFDEAVTLIEREADRLILRGELAGLVAWVRVLPRDMILSHPHLCVLFAVGLILLSEGAEASVWADDLENSLKERGKLSPQIEGEIVVIRASLLLFSGNFTGAVALASEALKWLPAEDRLLRALALWITSIIGMVGDDNLDEVGQRIDEIGEESLRAGNILVAYIALITKVGIETYQGRLHRAAQTSHEALRLILHTGGEALPIAAMAYCMLGEIRREWNDLDGAEADIRRALEIGMYPNNAEFLNDGLVTLAMIQAERGHGDEALAAFEQHRQLIRNQQLAQVDLLQMEVMRVRVLIMYGHSAAIARWADERRQERKTRKPEMDFSVLREAEALALARVALAQGSAAETIASLEDLSNRAEHAGRLHDVLEARMLLARARWAIGESQPALRDLDAALALAAPEGFVRLFLDEGEPMADLLAGYVTARPPSTERTHALKLLAAFGRVVEPPLSHPNESLLSTRELDVLHLLAAGRSNEAIAADLVVALSTVKWHVARIYRKLGVTGRIQAVARARELRLIA
jgi:LuxR family maltose regulon positive regulatory protein